MDSFVKNLPLIYCPLPLPLLLLAEVESGAVGEGRRGEWGTGYWGATVGKVKISIRLSVTAMSHPRKTDTEAETALPGVCFNMTLTASTLTRLLVLLLFFLRRPQPIIVQKKV